MRIEEIGGATAINADCMAVLPSVPDESIHMVLTDIPYGEVDQKSSGLRKLDRGIADACDFDTRDLVAHLVRVTTGSIYIFCGTQQISPLVGALKYHGLTTRVGVWEKTNPSPMNGTRLWLSGLEFCVYARKANAIFNEHCKKALWPSASGRAKVHPTEKPVGLMERLIRASSEAGQFVLDCCMGSGTTGVACAVSGRRFIGIERDTGYFEIALGRLRTPA